jgi:hypothetical protein
VIILLGKKEIDNAHTYFGLSVCAKLIIASELEVRIPQNN